MTKEKLKRAKRCFSSHKATFTDYGNIKILDFKNPDSIEYRIRFLFEEDYCRLHISGDLGELTAYNYNNMTYEKFGDFVDNIGYFRDKICCHSRDLQYFDRDVAKEDLKKWIDEIYTLKDFVNEKLRNYYNDDWSDEELLDDFFDDVLVNFDEYGHISERGFEDLCEKTCAEWEDVCDFGKARTDILEWYMLAFKLAQEDLKKRSESNE